MTDFLNFALVTFGLLSVYLYLVLISFFIFCMMLRYDFSWINPYTRRPEPIDEWSVGVWVSALMLSATVVIPFVWIIGFMIIRLAVNLYKLSMIDVSDWIKSKWFK